MKYIVKDRREVVELSAPGKGGLTLKGKFAVKNRILDLTDAQVQLYGLALDEALAEGTLLLPKA